MGPTKFANRPADLHPVLRMRFSPRAFAETPIPPDILLRLFDAARWSASSGNGQPWRFVIAGKDDPEAFRRIFSTLVPGNQRWAGSAPLLGIAVARLTSERSGQPNRFAAYDTGQAMAHLSIQAEADGLRVHQMGGFDVAKAREVLGIPEEYEPMAAFVVGYEGDPETLPEDLRAKELAEGTRKGLDEVLFKGHWPG